MSVAAASSRNVKAWAAIFAEIPKLVPPISWAVALRFGRSGGITSQAILQMVRVFFMLVC